MILDFLKNRKHQSLQTALILFCVVTLNDISAEMGRRGEWMIKVEQHISDFKEYKKEMEQKISKIIKHEREEKS